MKTIMLADTTHSIGAAAIVPNIIQRLSRAMLALLLLPSLTQAQGFKEVGLEYQRTNPRFLALFRDVVSTPNQSVVRVRSNDKEVAVGIVVGTDGWILTKAHDLSGALTCRLRDSRIFSAKVIAHHDANDLALLRIDAKGLTPIVWGDSKQVAVGQWVACCGMIADPAAVGVVSVATRQLPPPAPSTSGYLGVSVLSAEGGGVRVTQVIAGSAASLADLRENDVLTQFNDQSIADADAFVDLMQIRKSGELIKLMVKRGKEQRLVETKLGSRPAHHRGDFQNRLGSDLSTRTVGYTTILQHDAVVRPIDCGGPIVDIDGKVIGLTICRAGRTETWALPVEVVQATLSEMFADRLVQLLRDRLLVMPEVARTKWSQKLAIHDPEREKAFLDRMVRDRPTNLNEATVRSIFQAQLEASKLWQEEFFARWQRDEQPAFTDAKDLVKDLRPMLDRLSTEILDLLGQNPSSEKLLARSEAVLRDLPPQVRDRAMSPWVKK